MRFWGQINLGNSGSENETGASLVAQCYVQSLVWEDPTCHGATKPLHHDYRACALQQGNCSNEKPVHRNWRTASMRRN